jgi:hypothetical protein
MPRPDDDMMMTPKETRAEKKRMGMKGKRKGKRGKGKRKVSSRR